MKKRFTFLFAMLAALVTTATADNVISADPLTIAQNGTAELKIYLKNSEVVRGLQFTLTLPAGVTVKASSVEEAGISEENYKPANRVNISTTDITNGWWALGNDVSTTENPRTYKFVMLDPSGAGLAASESARAILKISFVAAADAKLAETSVAMSDIHMSKAGTTVDATQTNTTESLNVVEFIKGDVDNDGIIDVNDIVLVVKYIQKKNPSPFNESAANVDGDQVIDVNDVVNIVKYILKKITSLSRGSIEESEDIIEPE